MLRFGRSPFVLRETDRSRLTSGPSLNPRVGLEPPVPLAPRQPHPVDRLASDQPARELPGAAAEAAFTSAAQHNSAEAAQRLVEAVLRRHRRS
jgi:hypothetical protein